MPFKPGDVVDVFFPYRDREGGKHRFMVVVSTAAHQERSGSLTGVGLFSDLPPAQHEAYKIEAVQGSVHGWIHAEVLMTVSLGGVKKKDEIKPAQLTKILNLVHGNLAAP